MCEPTVSQNLGDSVYFVKKTCENRSGWVDVALEDIKVEWKDTIEKIGSQVVLST